jgi:hypothetical protein
MEFSGRVLDPGKAQNVRPWQPAVASPPVVRPPRFMLGGRLAVIREPQFMRDPATENDPAPSASDPLKTEKAKLSMVDPHGE